MNAIQDAKAAVRSFRREFDAFTGPDMKAAAKAHCAPGFLWRGMYPFGEIEGYGGVVDTFWAPLSKAFSGLHRREDIFFAGANDAASGQGDWVCSMGHLVGLFDHDFLSIPANGRLTNLRYAEFFRVENGKLYEGALFVDLLGLMHDAGCYPLPPMTGQFFCYPGPRTHDGLVSTPQPQRETEHTLALVNEMIADLRGLNDLEKYRCPPDLLRKTWHENMVWYGPCGIGASFTIERYQEQHQYPFRLNLADKSYKGHVARIAEGHYCAFFGWANLRNRNTGGFLGLPAAREAAEMRIVDVYRRDGDKLAENWVFIDLPHYLAQQGLDVFARLKELRRIPG
ncbi:MAG: ester cyclase [Pseudomonadota bacterium]